jgi:hypothetical protein
MALPDGVVASAAQYPGDSSDTVFGFEYRTTSIAGPYGATRATIQCGDIVFAIYRETGSGEIVLDLTGPTSITIANAHNDAYGTWQTVRVVSRLYGGDISVPTVATRPFDIYINGSLVESATVHTWLMNREPAVQTSVGYATNNTRLDSYYGAHSDDTWYAHAGLPELFEFRNIFFAFNGVIRYYDQCTDGHVEFGNTSYPQAYHSPRVGETIGIYETTAGITVDPMALGYYTDTIGGTLMFSYWPYPQSTNLLAHGGGVKRAHKMLHCVSGAEMRGLLHPEWPSAQNVNLHFPLFWPHYEQISRGSSGGSGPYEFETATYGSNPRDDAMWVQPTRTELGNLHRSRYLLDNPDSAPLTLLEGIGVGPVVSHGEFMEHDYLPTLPFGSLPEATGVAPWPWLAYNAFDGNHDRTAWFTDSGTPSELCGQDGQGRPFGVGYEAQAGPLNARYNPTLCRDSCNDLEDQRDDVVASEDATLVLDPVSGELAFVALQDAWASNAEGDYDVNLVTQRIGYESGAGYVLETPGVVATLGAADLDEAWQLADATIDERGRLWVAVWRVASAGTAYGYSTMQALVYRADSLGQAATLISTVTVDRPPHNAAWLVWDRIADEAFLAMQDTDESQGLVIIRLPMLDGETASTSYVTAGDGSLPTPPYGAFYAAGQDLPHRLLAVWIDEAGRWRARWAWAEWFNAYSTTNVVVQALAADTAEDDYANWPNVYPGLTGDTRNVGIEPVFMEDIAENEADLHPLTGAAAWSDRDLTELIQGAAA